MTRKNELVIQRVRHELTEAGPQSTRNLMRLLDLSKAKVQGALLALAQDGVIISEGTTVNRMHRIAGDQRAPVVAPPASGKRKASSARAPGTVTSAVAAALGAAPPWRALMTHRGEIQVHKAGAVVDLDAAEALELHAFLESMSPVLQAQVEGDA